MMNFNTSGHAASYGVYVATWGALMALTVLTFGISMLDLKHLTVLAALMIAAVKGSLVLLYFMHVRHERPLFLYMFLAVGLTYAVFIGLTFVDYWSR